MRVAGAVRWATPVPPPGARCHHLSTSPSGNCWPACSTICARASRGSVKIKRQHVLQLIAEADGAAALVGADAAEQARGVELIGQPRIHQPVEIGPIGLDLDLTEPLGPGGAGRGELALDHRRPRPPRLR